jgi:transcriptional regulator with XRE-family HTH domain
MPGRTGDNAVAAREQLGRRVRDLRVGMNLSQEGLANLSGIHRTYISSMERGQRNVSLDILVRLAAALEVEPAELFRGWH